MSTKLPSLAREETTDFLVHEQHKDLLRFITCGSVDDGKSTLIGRLLLETSAVYEDQLASLQQESKKHGTTDLPIDPALLVDGLEDERQQGITIDVAYRYFQTPKRKFIIADSPGHEQYTRNMATAASTAQVAIILVDARKGLLTQTRRHTFVASLLGIRRVILAVNKMDLVDYNQTVFEQIADDFRAFVRQLDVREVHYLPLSGLQGENVTTRSHRMPWYEGDPLIEVLEQVSIDANDHGEFRFPVQRVSRPDANFRGYSGTIVSGSVRVGDPVVVLPGQQRSHVRSIVTFDGDKQHATSGEAVTLTLADEIDVTRGNMIVRHDQLPQVSQHIDANLVWMSHQPLVPGKSYWFKHTTHRTSAELTSIAHRIDVNTLKRVDAASLGLNEIGQCQLMLHAPMAFDPYLRNRRTGSFIMVDRVSHETVAAGMILDDRDDQQPHHRWNLALRSQKLQFTTSRISARERQVRYGHAARTILLTGLSGSGKTTIAFALEERLFAAGQAVMVLDGQNLRHGISRDLGFSADERSENLRRAAEIARMVNDAGMICVAAFVAPDEAIRAKARQVIGADRMLHIHLSAPVSVCRDRDLSGRYEAAECGNIVSFPGITAPYQEPTDADLTIPTDQWSVEHCLEVIERWLLPRLDVM